MNSGSICRLLRHIDLQYYISYDMVEPPGEYNQMLTRVNVVSKYKKTSPSELTPQCTDIASYLFKKKCIFFYYRKVFENMIKLVACPVHTSYPVLPVNTKHLYNIHTTSATLVQHCINVIQRFRVYWEKTLM